MNVAIICTEKLPVPAIRGGAIQVYIDGVAPRLAAKHSLTVFGIADPDLPARETRRGIEYVRLAAPSARDYVEGLRVALRERSFDIVHLFNRPRWLPLLVGSAPRSAWLLSLHNDMFAPHKLSAQEAQRAVALARAIVTVSRFIGGRVAAACPAAAEKLETVYSGVDAGQFAAPGSPQARDNRQRITRRLGITAANIVLCVSRLSEKKGIHIVLDALPLIAAAVPDVALLVVGSKWYGSNKADGYVAALHQKAAAMRQSVTFTGFVRPDEVPRYYSCADVFICASQWEEPLSRTLYEAMAAGIPVVTTNRGGNVEVIRGSGCGLVVDEFNSPGAFAATALHILENPPAAHQMGAVGRLLAETTYSWKRVTADLEAIYARVRGA